MPRAVRSSGVERALGLRVKLGWAMVIVVERGVTGPVVVARDELRFSAEDGVFAYHTAMDVEPEQRDAVVAEGAARAADAATAQLVEALDRHQATRIGLVVGRGVRRIPLDRILASSQLFHTAEAELVQDAFAEAAERLTVPCTRLSFAAAEADPDWPTVNDLGKVAGRPWRKDEKLATTAGWVALRPAST